MQTQWYAADAKSSYLATMMGPEFGDCAALPRFRWTFDVEGDATIATPWGQTSLATYKYGSEIYVSENIDGYHLSLGSYMERLPNDDLSIEVYEWGTKYKKAYLSWVCFYCAEDGTFSWTSYDEDGKSLAHGEF